MDNMNSSIIPFKITKKTVWMFFVSFLILDMFFVMAYLISTLPEIKSLTVSGKLAFIDLDTEANLPTNYAILKLYLGSIFSGLMIFWYKQKTPFFWKVSFFALFILGLDESAQLHELWAAGLAAKLFGNEIFYGNQFTVFPYLLILGSFYICSLSLFPKTSIASFLFFVSSGITLILSQAVEISFQPAISIMMFTFEALSFLTKYFSLETLMFAWEEGLELLSYTLIFSGVINGIHNIQRNLVHKHQGDLK